MAQAATRRKPRNSNRATGKSGSAQPARRIPGWLLLGIGVIAGASLSPGYRWLTTAPGNGADSTLSGKSQSDSAERIKFKFYELLPQRDIEITTRQPAATPRTSTPKTRETKPAAAPQKPTQTTASSPHYYLQAGSFRKPAEAEKRRIELLLLDLESEINRVTSKGNTWYRLQLGPYQSTTKVASIRSTLNNEGIETLVIKRQGN